MDIAEYDEVDIVGGDGDCEDKMVKRSLSKNLNRATSYLTVEVRLAFTKTLILWHFDLECYIQIKIDASGYAIDGGLS